jgi:hypothetical protein
VVASLLNRRPLYIGRWRQGTRAKPGMVRRRIDVTVRPAAMRHPRSDLTTVGACFAGAGGIGEHPSDAERGDAGKRTFRPHFPAQLETWGLQRGRSL